MLEIVAGNITIDSIGSGAGLERFAGVALKSWLSAQAAIVLAASTSFPDLLQAMRAVRVPRRLVAIVNSLGAKLPPGAKDELAKMKAEKMGGVAANVFALPKKRPDSPQVEAVYVLHKDMLVVTDRRDLCEQVVSRLNGTAGETLSQVPAFAATMARCAKEEGDMQPHIRWFVGAGPHPRFDHFTYWEKFDYWAVFWGMGIIGGSGLILWLPETFAYVVPGWVFNIAALVHGEEALLAVVFIFTFHFFTGHLRPEKFPMDSVIFTGRVHVDELKHERPLEYERLAAPELGGVVLGAGLSLELGLPLLLVRKTSKEYGTSKRIEGRFEVGETIAVVEDIVTSGGAAIQAAEALREAGLVVQDLYCVVDREEGGREAAAAAGLVLRPLFTSSELGISSRPQ